MIMQMNGSYSISIFFILFFKAYIIASKLHTREYNERNKNRPLYLFLPSFLFCHSRLDLGTLKIPIRVCLRDALQPPVY